MDVIKDRAQKKLIRKTIAVSLALATAFVAFFSFTKTSVEHRVTDDDLIIGAVERGEFVVSVDGYGVLSSNEQTLITATTDATVNKVILRPGDTVEVGSIIVELSNPELIQNLEEAKIALDVQKANLRRLIISNKSTMLDEKSTLAELQANLEDAQLTVEAQETLVEGGIVSKLSYKSSLLQERQMAQRLNLQRERMQTLEELAKEAVIIQQEAVKQAYVRYQIMLQRVDKLIVKADFAGILQRLPIELGQSVSAGDELALIGSDTNLLALVQVPQSQAQNIKPGQSAVINTRTEASKGRVSRVTPEVVDGTVEVEIEFEDAVPASARLELNVNATIVIEELSNVLFVKRPLNSQTNQIANLFKLSPDGKTASATAISFGLESGNYIEVRSGAIENEKLILSGVPSVHLDKNQIHLLN